ncbi:calcium/sodium antiporter [uncultured Draconibacterium sp.]|uniref:calcium/sodium antiporter n=1 Tax=uncultured Draconibacterium sp. TaxID=1573823 RepID=UPI003216CA8F
MFIPIILIAFGFIALVLAANWLVDGSSALARKYNVSDLVIGLTIVAFGTSAPELVVSIIASTNNHSDLVLGNIIGSNNFNLFIILGLSGMLFPISVKSSTAWREIPISLIITILLLLIANGFGSPKGAYIGRLDGIILLTLFFVFLYYVFTQIKKENNSPTQNSTYSALKMWSLITIGLLGLILGGQLVVTNSVKMANHLGISEKIIGLTIVAAGTSLPELVTSIVAAVKKNSDIAVGNVIGSNVFNILLILSVSSIIKPINFNPNFNTDLFLLTGGTAFLLLAMISGKRKTLDRWEAAILVVVYIAYTVYLIQRIAQ